MELKVKDKNLEEKKEVININLEQITLPKNNKGLHKLKTLK